jgi:hypothetical protein
VRPGWDKRDEKNHRGLGITRFHLFCVLVAHGKKRTQPRATALQWGLLVFFVVLW